MSFNEPQEVPSPKTENLEKNQHQAALISQLSSPSLREAEALFQKDIEAQKRHLFELAPRDKLEFLCVGSRSANTRADIDNLVLHFKEERENALALAFLGKIGSGQVSLSGFDVGKRVKTLQRAIRKGGAKVLGQTATWQWFEVGKQPGKEGARFYVYQRQGDSQIDYDSISGELLTEICKSLKRAGVGALMKSNRKDNPLDVDMALVIYVDYCDRTTTTSVLRDVHKRKPHLFDQLGRIPLLSYPVAAGIGAAVELPKPKWSFQNTIEKAYRNALGSFVMGKPESFEDFSKEFSAQLLREGLQEERPFLSCNWLDNPFE